MKFSGDEKKLYASGGNDNWIAEYAVENKKLIFKDTIVLGKNGVTKENNALYIIDLKTKKIAEPFALGGEAFAQCKRVVHQLLGMR